MAYTVIRRYTVEPGNVDEIVRRAEQGFIPMVSRAPGFITYRLVRTEDGDLITVSTFETRAQGEESVESAAGWVRENLGPLAPTPPEVVGGQVLVRHVDAAEQPRFGVMRRYRNVRNLGEGARRVEAGLVPILSRQPGFASYALLDTGDGGAISLSAFRDRDVAERSSEEVRAWVQQNLADVVSEPPETTTGEILAGRAG